MKVLTILGARPQFIKAANVSRELLQHKPLREIIVHTGQHYDNNMSDVFFEQMHIPKPDYFLGIGGKSHATMTGQMMEEIERVAIKEEPDWVIVYGDTNSTLAGAITAKKLHIKLAHIEAGLRSFNNKMPEEINRILTDRISDLLFCPTDTALKNLSDEGFNNFDCKIIRSGDVMQDGAQFYKKQAIKPNIDVKQKFALCTIHRAENTDDPTKLQHIFLALKKIAESSQVILPLHPRTRRALRGLSINLENISIIDPVGYLEMVWLIQNAHIIMTDSGGLQKEAFFFGKPCITLREETEWVELIDHNFNFLAGSDAQKIVELYHNRDSLFSNDFSMNLYGNGQASSTIVKHLLQ